VKVALYARVSKNDESQDPENQLVPLRDFVRALGADEVFEYVDLASGGNGDRQGFLRMLEDADQRKFDNVSVWALDRISREGISTTLGYLERFKRNGIGVRSLKEPWMDTSSGEIGQLLLAIFSWVAQQERKRIIERTKAGLERARNAGKRLGRPKGAGDKKERRKSGYWLRYAKKA
jgi:DNA invertase Pin-like site-specific DNA recombinase